MIRAPLVPFALVVGDIIALMAAVPVALFLRTFSAPTTEYIGLHIVPFSLLALLSVVVYFSAGLYDAPTTLIRRELPGTILAAQVFNVVLAALFFFFVPVFVIAPKTTLLIYLATSALFVTAWRFAALSFSRSKDDTVVVIGNGEDTETLLAEFSEKGLLPFRALHISPEADEQALALSLALAFKRSPVFVVADLDDPRLAKIVPLLNRYEGEGGKIVDFSDFYERVFKRLPLSAMSYRNLLQSRGVALVLYDAMKRILDVMLSVPLLALFLVLLPFVYLALRFEGPGPLFIHQERIGRNWQKIRVTKFRTMTQHKPASSEWTVEEKQNNKVTNVGAFLRKTSIDELPQVFSVLSGDLSLIGPRSDIAGLGERLSEEIPSYRARYSVTPGISGWAQVNQRYAPGNISPQSVEESRTRLMYDLYYVKHRSLFLDASITLRTVKTLLTRLLPQ